MSSVSSHLSLADLVAGCPVVVLDAGTTLRPGDFSHVELLAVQEGLVVLRSTVPGSSRRTITCHAGPGALVLPPSGGEELVGLSDATIRVISASERARLLESADGATVLLDALSETLRQKQVTIANMGRLPHVDRIRETLFELARAHGRVGTEGIRLDFPLTHDLLGEMTGSARETVTRALDQLQREGLVVRRGRTYSLHLPAETSL